MSPRSSGTSKRVEQRRRLVVSFHDLHPGSQEACAAFLRQMDEIGVDTTSLLVVPRWHGGRPCSEDNDFTDWLRLLAAHGHDVCLHGLYHQVDELTGGLTERLVGRFYTRNEGEFYQIDRATADERVREGLDILAEEAGLPVTGFTPPAWLLSEAGRKALIAAGLRYSTTFSEVDLLQEDSVVPAPTIVWSSRAAWRRLVSRIWVRFWARRQANAPVLRIAAHPVDFEYPEIEASIYACIRSAVESGREAVSYRGLVADASLTAKAP